MSSFTTPLIVSPLSDGRNWRLCRSFTYHIGTKHSRHYIRVPKGFITDFASTPNFLWNWLPYWGKYGKAAIVHDWLYKKKEIQGKPVTRCLADKIFKEAMIVGGTPSWKAQLMYLAVHWFGWLAWKEVK